MPQHCPKCDHEVQAIDTSSNEWCDLMDLIQKYVNLKKEDLVHMCYDDSGEGDSKLTLRSMSKGELVVKAIESVFA